MKDVGTLEEIGAKPGYIVEMVESTGPGVGTIAAVSEGFGTLIVKIPGRAFYSYRDENFKRKWRIVSRVAESPTRGVMVEDDRNRNPDYAERDKFGRPANNAVAFSDDKQKGIRTMMTAEILIDSGKSPTVIQLLTLIARSITGEKFDEELIDSTIFTEEEIIENLMGILNTPIGRRKTGIAFPVAQGDVQCVYKSPEKDPKTVLDDIRIERQRQIHQEGFTASHDDELTECELARAAAVYATSLNHSDVSVHGVQIWPWSKEWWKPKSYRENLVKAAALLVAEIERLDRYVEKNLRIRQKKTQND